MQYFVFAQIFKFHLKFAQILPKSNQICPNLTNFDQKFLLGDATASPAPMALHTKCIVFATYAWIIYKSGFQRANWHVQ